MTAAVAGTEAAPVPMAMLAELTHRCPLKCPYCSNPLDLVRRSQELSTKTWLDVFHQAAAMGVLQLHISGGEPAARRDLEELTTGARDAGLYTNLITSGVGLTEARLAELAARGLDHVQLSVQGVDAATADRISGYAGGFEAKMRLAGWIAREGLPLTVNAVVHRQNMDRLDETIDLALRLGARRLEIASVQFHGWALVNREALMPVRDQVMRAGEIVAAARDRLRDVMVIDYVTSDHFGKYPKPCMGGWGRIGFCVTPAGKVLPCHAAETISALAFETVHDRPLADIWADGAAFRAFRGIRWMPEPCRSCDRKTRDWGGCRCQAFAWNGNAGTTDPVCSKAPAHADMADAAALASRHGIATFRYRAY